VLGPEGEVERGKLAAIVFADAAQRQALEGMVFPYIGKRAAEEILKSRAALVVLDAAVLLEAGWDSVCDRVVFVDAAEEVRQARVMGQRGWRPGERARREAAQLPLTEKRGRADHVLDNSSTLDHLGRQIDDLMCLWGVAPAVDRRGPAAPLS
jgi:dephospho-CoA kinase